MMGSKGRPIWMDVESGSGLLKAAILSSRSRSAQSTVRAQIHAALSTPWVARTVSTLMWRNSTAPPASANRVIDSMIRFSPVAGIACTLAMSSRLYLAVFKPPSVSAAAFISEPLDREMLTPPMPCLLPVSQLQGEGYSPLHVLLLRWRRGRAIVSPWRTERRLAARVNASRAERPLRLKERLLGETKTTNCGASAPFRTLSGVKDLG